MRAIHSGLTGLLLLVSTNTATMANAEESASSKEEARTFFASVSGAWTCAGQFADGRPLVADLRFTPIMEGNAVVYEHTDKDKTTFQSVGMWSYDDRLSAPVFLRFSGKQGTQRSSAAMFIGGDVTDSSLVFTADDLAGPPWKPNRFLWELSDDDVLKMTWEVEKDGQMSFGDRISCERSG